MPRSLKNFLLWCAVVVAPVIGFVAATLMVSVFLWFQRVWFGMGEGGLWSWMSYNIVLPVAAGFAASRLPAVIAPGHRIMCSVYGGALHLIVATISALGLLMSGDHNLRVGVAAGIAGSGIAIWMTVQEPDSTELIN